MKIASELLRGGLERTLLSLPKEASSDLVCLNPNQKDSSDVE